ncbi:hypothetical protein BST61_g2962 [Cercospora zeina]
MARRQPTLLHSSAHINVLSAPTAHPPCRQHEPARGNGRLKRSLLVKTTANVANHLSAVANEASKSERHQCRLQILDNNILGPSYCIDPSNKKALQAALDHARRSTSPSRYPDSNFESFTKANYQAQNESELVSKVVHPFFTSYFGHPSSTDLAFTTLEPAVPAPYKMPVPKPDHSFGAAKQDINPSVRQSLGKYIGPTGRPLCYSLRLHWMARSANVRYTSYALSQKAPNV